MLYIAFQAGTISAVGISTAQSSNNANAIANQNSVSTATCKKVVCCVPTFALYTQENKTCSLFYLTGE